MKWALLALALLACTPAHGQPVWPGGSATSGPFYCQQTVQGSTATGATAQMVALVGGQAVRICGMVITATAASTAQLQYGTGTNCGTGTTAVSPAFNLAAATPLVAPGGIANILIPVSQALCITIGGTGPVQWMVSYTQF